MTHPLTRWPTLTSPTHGSGGRCRPADRQPAAWPERFSAPGEGGGISRALQGGARAEVRARGRKKQIRGGL